MANNIPGWGGQPAKKSNITPKNKSKRVGPKQGIKRQTNKNKFNKLKKESNTRRNQTFRRIRGSQNLSQLAVNGNENRNNNNENRNNNVGLPLEDGGGGGGGGGRGLFEPSPLVKPMPVRAYPPPLAAAFAFQPHAAEPPAAAAPAGAFAPVPQRRARGMGFNMANIAAALPNLGPAAAGGGPPPRRNNSENEFRRRKTRKN